MNRKSIELSPDPVLRAAFGALLRAAERARERARRTQTRLVVSQGGRIHHLEVDAKGVAEMPGSYSPGDDEAISGPQ